MLVSVAMVAVKRRIYFPLVWCAFCEVDRGKSRREVSWQAKSMMCSGKPWLGGNKSCVSMVAFVESFARSFSVIRRGKRKRSLTSSAGRAGAACRAVVNGVAYGSTKSVMFSFAMGCGVRVRRILSRRAVSRSLISMSTRRVLIAPRGVSDARAPTQRG